MKSLVFSGQTTRLTSFLPPPPLSFVHGIVFPLLLSLLGYFLFPSSPLFRPRDRSIVEKLQALRDPTNPFTLALPSFPSRTDHHPRSYFLIVILQISSKGTCSKKRIIKILESGFNENRRYGSSRRLREIVTIQDGPTKCVNHFRILYISFIENCKCKGENTFVIQVYSNYSLLSFDIFPFPFFVLKSFV